MNRTARAKKKCVVFSNESCTLHTALISSLFAANRLTFHRHRVKFEEKKNERKMILLIDSQSNIVRTIVIISCTYHASPPAHIHKSLNVILALNALHFTAICIVIARITSISCPSFFSLLLAIVISY